jgi:hypothetical protein
LAGFGILTKRRTIAVVGKIDVKSNGFVQLAEGPFTASDLRNIMKRNTIMRNMRANVINNALWVEGYLDDIIRKVLFTGKREMVFRDSIYEDLGFAKKGDIFKSIVRNEIVHLSKPEEAIRVVREIITIRNSFAHGKVIFRRKKTILQTLKGREIELNDSYPNRVNRNFIKARDLLGGILRDPKPH